MEETYLPSDSQKSLLDLSRQTLESFVRGSESPADKIEDPYLLTHQYGAFVSLHKGEDLRGCIGICFPTRSLYETVQEMTEAAAARDYRFPQISIGELADIHIEISILSPLRLVQDPLSLEVGRHGLYIVCREKGGVLLPQVATRHGWDMTTFLRQTCLKAGLPEEAWRGPETQVSSFTALILEEER